MKRLALLLILLLLPASSMAAVTWVDGSGNTTGIDRTVGKGEKLCMTFVNADGTFASSTFEIGVMSASIIFTQNQAGASGAAVVEVEACPYGTPGANTCHVADTFSTDGDHNNFSRGRYRFDVTTGAGAGETPVLCIQAND